MVFVRVVFDLWGSEGAARLPDRVELRGPRTGWGGIVMDVAHRIVPTCRELREDDRMPAVRAAPGTKNMRR